MYENNLPHPLASNQMIHVLLASFLMRYSPIYAYLHARLRKIIGIVHVMRETQAKKVHINPYMLIKSH